jgi:hypothetical protein
MLLYVSHYPAKGSQEIKKKKKKGAASTTREGRRNAEGGHGCREKGRIENEKDGSEARNRKHLWGLPHAVRPLWSNSLVDAGGYRSAKTKCFVDLEATTQSLNDDTGNLVGISVGRGATVLEVTLAVLGDLAGDTDGTTTVGNTVRELIDVTGLVATSETLLVALTVDGDVLNVAGLELLHGGLDDLHTTIGTGSVGGNVGVQTGTVPLTLDGLGLEGNADTELLSDAVKQETGHPEVVTH